MVPPVAFEQRKVCALQRMATESQQKRLVEPVTPCTAVRMTCRWAWVHGGLFNCTRRDQAKLESNLLFAVHFDSAANHRTTLAGAIQNESQ